MLPTPNTKIKLKISFSESGIYWIRLHLTDGSKAKVEAAIIGPGSWNFGSAKVNRSPIFIATCRGPLFPQLVVDDEAGLLPQVVDVNEEQEDEAAKEQVDVKKLHKIVF